eukprot:TRINITY_DN1666_c1_g1_i2.p2 TRINITY_DN1666_c1_g1~~TRINITY_DN1666_c1_g1_i2.p2  ORF type:complete len:144 (-),score=29.08 TRINITY_DN1666_c1_g1_i2:311-742(-)
MNSTSFTSELVKDLQYRDIPNLGMNCPQHKGGNAYICVTDFTHRTHIDIFGYHYPKDFRDWYCDDWISHVYGVLGKSTYSRKLKGIYSRHHAKSQRYERDYEKSDCEIYRRALKDGRKRLEQYIKEHHPSYEYPDYEGMGTCN